MPALRRAAASAGIAGLLALAYVAAAKTAFGLAFVHTSISPVWLPSGLSVAAVLVFGYRAVPGVLAGAWLFNTLTAVPWWVAALIAVGNTLEAAAAGWLLRWARIDPSLGRVRSVLALVGLGALLPAMLSAAVGVGTLMAAGVQPTAGAAESAVLWWSGDAVGVLTLTPVLLLAHTAPRLRLRLTRRQATEAVVLALAVPLTIGLGMTAGIVGPFLVFPALVWAVIRFQQLGAALASMAGVAVTVWASAHGVGPFTRPDLSESLLLTQSYVAIMVATSLLLAAMTVERERAHLALRQVTAEAEERNRELERERAQLGEAQRLARLGSWTWDFPSDALWWSGELCRIFGLEPHGNPPGYEGFLAMVHPGDRERVRVAVATSITEDTPLVLEHRIVRPDGGVRVLVSLGRVIRDPSGSVRQLVGTAQDVTSQQRIAEALRIQQERTRAIIATASDAFFGINEAGVVTDWNQMAEVTFGWPAAEAVGVPLAGLVTFADPGSGETGLLEAAVAAPLANPLERRLEVLARRRDGTELPVELAAWLIDSADGRQLNAFASDITERKQAEQALAAARDQAVEASQLKSRFLAMMSHEIRTPMNGVIGLSELLLAGPMDAEQHRYAAGIHTAGQALLSVINDILDLSKLEARAMVIEAAVFDLDAVLADVIALNAEAARIRGLALTSSRDPDLPTALCGDQSRLRQILLNLVSNAVRFTETGSVAVHAVLAEPPGPDGACRVRIEVADTGIGIPAARHAQMFDPFVQADASTTREYGGTGLGLTISMQLAEMMGGELGLRSKVGVGSTFWLVVPLGAAESPARAGPGGPPTAAIPGGRHVLLVEDNDLNQIVAAGFLERLGCTLDIAVNGEEAVVMAEGGSYDLIFMDCQMPHMDGYAAAAALRQLGGGRVDTPIVALTASTLATDRERCLVAGMDDFIAKPVTLAELGAALTRWTVAAGRSRHSTLAGHPVLDASRLDSITGGDTADADPALARHLASVFLSSAPAHLAGLASAVRIGDAGAAARHAHALKGVCGSFGADGMAMLATQLDMLASAHELGTAEELVSSLHLELHGVRREVNSYLGALAASTGASAENGHAAGDQRVPR